MNPLKSPRAFLFLGITLLLVSPLIAMTPKFTPPNHCPALETVISSTTVNATMSTSITPSLTPILISSSATQTAINPCVNFPNVTYPLIPDAVSLGGIGLILVIVGYIKSRRAAPKPLTTFAPLISIACVLFLAGLFLMGFIIRGNGWAIGLYGLQGNYLFALGVAVALFTIFRVRSNWRSAIILSVGIVLSGYSFFSLYATYTDFLPRCFVEVGCSPVLARSTVFGVIMLGLLLALATFLMGYGIASFRKR